MIRLFNGDTYEMGIVYLCANDTNIEEVPTE